MSAESGGPTLQLSFTVPNEGYSPEGPISILTHVILGKASFSRYGQTRRCC